MRCGDHFGIFTSGQLQSRSRCWILKSLLFDDAPRPFHKQEHLLAKGKEVHNITALSFNNCSHISNYYHCYFLFLVFIFLLFARYSEHTLSHCFFNYKSCGECIGVIFFVFGKNKLD